MSVSSDRSIWVAVRLFARAREVAGSETVNVAVPVGARIADLRSALGEASPPLRPLVPHLLFAIGTEYASDETLVPPNADLVAFPPVSGG
jgi:molybdopterin converting factor small subunit